MAMQNFLLFINTLFRSYVRIESIKILSYKYFSYLYLKKTKENINENTGDISQRLNQASNEIHSLIRNISYSVIPPFLQITFSFFIIMAYGSYLVGLSILAYAIIFLIAGQYFNSKLITYRTELMDAGVKTYSCLTDFVKNISTVRACNSFDFLLGNSVNISMLMPAFNCPTGDFIS